MSRNAIEVIIELAKWPPVVKKFKCNTVIFGQFIKYIGCKYFEDIPSVRPLGRGGGGGGTRSDIRPPKNQISDIRPPRTKIKYQISRYPGPPPPLGRIHQF